MIRFSSSLLALGLLIICSLTATIAKDQEINWSFGALKRGHQVDLLQCQSLVFNWSSLGTTSTLYDVWEFADEQSHANCDFTNATPLVAEATPSGQFTFDNDDTLEVTKRWFGSSTKGHCSLGNVKLAVKVRPYFIEKYEQSGCVGGTVDIVKREDTLKTCRKRCKRRRGCIAIEYNTAVLKNCILYSTAPERRRSTDINPNSRCEIAATSCDGLQNEDEGDGEEPTDPTLLVPEVELFPTPDLVGNLVGFAGISGYGRATTTGGEGGKTVMVNNREDFIRIIKQDEPYVVLVDGMIDLVDPSCPCKISFVVRSNKTILGIGPKSGMTGGGLKVSGVKLERPPDWDPSSACICDDDEEGRDEDEGGERRFPRDITELPADVTPTNNVIIRNLVYLNCLGDCIGVDTFAHHVWIDHNYFSNPEDGAVDVKRASDLVTVSWNHFSDAVKTMLCGHSSENGPQDLGRLRVTYHHNYFQGTEQRHPRVRFADPVHIFNNYYQSILDYGVASTMDAGLVIEGNYFEDVKESIRTDVGEEPGRFVERDNMYERSGLPPVSSSDTVVEPDMYYSYKMHQAHEVPTLVQEWGGPGVIY